jgi:hypothetical protein
MVASISATPGLFRPASPFEKLTRNAARDARAAPAPDNKKRHAGGRISFRRHLTEVRLVVRRGRHSAATDVTRHPARAVLHDIQGVLGLARPGDRQLGNAHTGLMISTIVRASTDRVARRPYG